jgi:hypothetical protein
MGIILNRRDQIVTTAPFRIRVGKDPEQLKSVLVGLFSVALNVSPGP